MTHSPHKSLIVAEDDADDRMLFEDALREISHNTRLMMAHDGFHLMELLHTQAPLPDVVILDMNMPRKNGFECLEEIRSTPRIEAMPVIVFSTSADHNFVEQVYLRGANHYISKPVTWSSLKKAIQHVLNIDWREHAMFPPKEKFVIEV